MLDDPTECYKFYWLDSIMQLLSEQEENITFNKIIFGMIADAWYSVTEYHLRMRTKDNQGDSVNSIEKVLFELDGNVKYIRHTLYNCSASRPGIKGKTNEESREVQTDTLTIETIPLPSGVVKTKTGNEIDSTV